jgi:hypothetical protein
MSLGTAGLKTKHDFAGEALQQLTRPHTLHTFSLMIVAAYLFPKRRNHCTSSRLSETQEKNQNQKRNTEKS